MMRVSQDRNPRRDVGLKPLTARSAVLSALLGTHPPRLSARHLVRVGELFGIPEGTVRVALSRMLRDREVAQANGTYRLTGRLLERQARQDESRAPRTREWKGDWEMAVVTAGRRPPASRAALRAELSAVRLAELREGVWLRPSNLVRPLPDPVIGQCRVFHARPERNPVVLAASLWDLEGWARHAARLLGAMKRASGLAEGFVVSAAVLRHLLSDPVLPAELLPSNWPGTELRRAYDAFESAYRAILREHLRG